MVALQACFHYSNSYNSYNVFSLLLHAFMRQQRQQRVSVNIVNRGSMYIYLYCIYICDERRKRQKGVQNRISQLNFGQYFIIFLG